MPRSYTSSDEGSVPSEQTPDPQQYAPPSRQDLCGTSTFKSARDEEEIFVDVEDGVVEVQVESQEPEAVRSKKRKKSKRSFKVEGSERGKSKPEAEALSWSITGGGDRGKGSE